MVARVEISAPQARIIGYPAALDQHTPFAGRALNDNYRPNLPFVQCGTVRQRCTLTVAVQRGHSWSESWRSFAPGQGSACGSI